MSYLAQIAAKVAQTNRAQAKPRKRVTWDDTGSICIERLPKEHGGHRIGEPCPHCGGTGRYLIHTKQQWQKCYRCDGKGRLDQRDLEYLHMRVSNGGPISRIYGGH